VCVCVCVCVCVMSLTAPYSAVTLDLLNACLLLCCVGSAPEVPLYGDGHYTFALDMWSVGCVFGELLKMMDPRRKLPLTLFPVSHGIPDCISTLFPCC
jgi:hypothetical protein